MAGIAWEVGVLQGIGDVDSDLLVSLCASDVIIGTSAGAAVGAQIARSATIADLYSTQLSAHSGEIDLEVESEGLMARFTAAASGSSKPGEMPWRIGALAHETPTVSEPIRRAAVVGRLPAQRRTEQGDAQPR